MSDFVHKNEAFHIKTGFKIEMFKIILESVSQDSLNM